MANGRLFEASGGLFRANGRFFKPNGRLFGTNGSCFEANGRLFGTNQRLKTTTHGFFMPFLAGNLLPRRLLFQARTFRVIRPTNF
jgi:hypothetical protein